ncbi:hypothetical protein ACHWQZ_G010571, partial [Mnemiopsis leidyi]
ECHGSLGKFTSFAPRGLPMLPRIFILVYWLSTFVFGFLVPAFLGGTLTLRRWYIKNVHRLFVYCDNIINERKHLLGFDNESEEEISSEEEEETIRRSTRQRKRKHLPSYVEEPGDQEEVTPSFGFCDIAPLVMNGISTIRDDQVTTRFYAQEKRLWNMLTRTSIHPVFMSHRLNIIWFLSLVWRWGWLLPMRILVFLAALGWLCLATVILVILPRSLPWYEKCYEWMICLVFKLVTHSFSAMVKFHNPENKAKNGGICVANHTSPLDAAILSYDNCYSMIGQRHGGLLGLCQKILDMTNAHIWFERGESKDRQMVVNRLTRHCSTGNTLPVLIFPEGTCINNTSVMMFKKGSFEIDTVIYPVAIKYDTLFTEAFWNSSEQSFVQYLFMMLTSWALVCDVWYLPPMRRLPNENAIAFANRVKALIAQKGGLVDLQWDGMIKRKKLSERIRTTLMDLERQHFLESSVLPRNISHGNLSTLTSVL